MANTVIQLKFSNVTATPPSLNVAEPAYSYVSNTFFIGSPAGTGVIPIGGKFYLDQQQAIYDSVNAAYQAANSGSSSAAAFNQANSAFFHANAAFSTANTADNKATSAGVYANGAFSAANSAASAASSAQNSADGAFAAANGAVAVNLTQNNSIAAAFSAANGAVAVNLTQNNSITAAFNTANAAFASANNIDGVNTTQNNSIAAAFTRANNSVDANTGGTITGDVIINANLFVNGTTTFVNTVNQLIGDNIITLNADLPQNGYPTQDAGIEIERGVLPNSQILWIESAGKWSANNGNTSYYLADEAVDVTQNNSITAAFNTANTADSKAVSAGNYANAAFTRANNSLDANNGGAISGSVNITGNVYAGNVIANSGIESSPGIFGGSFGGNKLSLNNETNLISNRFDIVKIQTGEDGTVKNEFTFANNAFIAPGEITSGSVVAGGINVVPTLAATRDTANAAFGAANGAVAVNTTQNTNIGFAWNHANAAFDKANTDFTNVSITAANYGTASAVASFRVEANGRITSANNTAIAIDAGAITSGTLPVSRGGSGAGTFTTNGVLLGQGTSAFSTASSSTEGHVLTINASGVPTFAHLQGGTF